MGLERSFLAVVVGDEFAVGEADYHESAAAEVARAEGWVTAKAKPMATAVSMALPPWRSTRMPTSVASGDREATAPSRPLASWDPCDGKVVQATTARANAAVDRRHGIVGDGLVPSRRRGRRAVGGATARPCGRVGKARPCGRVGKARPCGRVGKARPCGRIRVARTAFINIFNALRISCMGGLPRVRGDSKGGTLTSSSGSDNVFRFGSPSGH